jgi:hypothetical protein
MPIPDRRSAVLANPASCALRQAKHAAGAAPPRGTAASFETVATPGDSASWPSLQGDMQVLVELEVGKHGNLGSAIADVSERQRRIRDATERPYAPLV